MIENMKTIELTEKQAELLKELLSLDMERMGFDSEESDKFMKNYNGLYHGIGIGICMGILISIIIVY